MNASLEDSETIYQLFENAISYQKKNNFQQWNGYDKALIQKEIAESTQYKLVINGQIAGIFSAGDAGPLETELWKEKTAIKSLYLNRIVVDQNFKGKRLFSMILDWSNTFTAGRGYKYLRLDTWADNPHLINYYKSFGFTDLGIVQTSGSPELPLQYRTLNLLIMEKEIIN
jgi:GNAT superfamily N-acetyltransferase